MWEKLLTEVVVPRSDMRAFTVLIIVIQFMWVPFLLFNALRNAEFMGRKLQIVVGWVVTLWIKEVFISIDHCRGKTFVFKNSKLTSQSLRIIAGFLREAEIVVCLNEVSHYQILTVLLSDFRQQLRIKRKKSVDGFFMKLFWISDALQSYRRHNNTLPSHIIIYRDGVGDGQIPYVFDHEVTHIQVRNSILRSFV